MRVKRTSRGFDRADFRDDYLHECSIQKSSSTEKHAIWLGVNEPNAQAFEPGEGWRDLKLPSNVQVSTRMHLTMRQVKALLPLLARFADTGELRLTTPKEPTAEPKPAQEIVKEAFDYAKKKHGWEPNTEPLADRLREAHANDPDSYEPTAEPVWGDRELIGYEPAMLREITELRATIERLEAGLKRLASMEAFDVGTVHVPDEVIKRVDYARAILAAREKEKP